jgi:hypothetical protein
MPPPFNLGSDLGTETLADYAAECYPLLTPTQLKNLLLRNPTPAHSPPHALLSPRMSAVLASSSASGSSYFGSLGFLDSQAEFDSTFPQPVPLLVSVSTTTGLSIDSLSLLAALNLFLDHCKFQIFLPIFRSDYVGTANHNDAASLHVTVQALKRHAMTSRNPVSGHWINLTPDELYAAYAELTPLLPNKVSLWGLNLVTQFHDALSAELQELLMTDSTYCAPDLSSLTTRSSQLSAVRSIRVAAVRHFSLQRAQEKLVARTVARKLKHIPSALTATYATAPPVIPAILASVPPSDDISALTRSFMSPAEQTMQRYQPASTSSAAGDAPSIRLPTSRVHTLPALAAACIAGPPE